jgi:VIT1/CCC1 family predicted Fe2+/Mn2+ transporter
MMAKPEHALEVLAREELGLNPDDLGSPIRAAASSFVSFAVGAAIPLLPFMAGLAGLQAIYTAAGVTSSALFGIGVLLSLFTGHAALRGGFRLMFIGAGAGLAAWSLGKLLGASIG